jgi:CDP-L-myo-inositol myo-inositolphosphotransferase
VLVHVASVLDGVDGEIARLKVRASAWGALFDGVLDRLGDAAVVAGLAAWALAPSQDHSPTVVAVLAALAASGSMLSMASKDRIAALRLPRPPERGISLLLGGHDARFLIVTVCGVAGRPLLALVVITGTSFISLLVRTTLVGTTLRAGRRGVL